MANLFADRSISASCRETRCSNHRNMFGDGFSRRQHIGHCDRHPKARGRGTLRRYGSCRDLCISTLLHVGNVILLPSEVAWLQSRIAVNSSFDALCSSSEHRAIGRWTGSLGCQLHKPSEHKFLALPSQRVDIFNLDVEPLV